MNMPNLINLRQKRWTRDASILIIFISGALLIHKFLYAPILYSDDWTQIIARNVWGTAQWIDLDNRRPLLFLPFVLLYRIWGLNIHAFYVTLAGLEVISAFLLYKIIDKLLPDQPVYTGTVALLFMLYPTTYTHTWLTMIHAYSALVSTLIYVYLMLIFHENRQKLILFASFIFLSISFGLYEAQLGLILLWLLIIFLRNRGRRSTSTNFVFILSLIWIAVFVSWRLWGQRRLNIPDEYMSFLVMEPTVLVRRLILGLKIQLIWGWTTLISNTFGFGTLHVLLALSLWVFGIIFAPNFFRARRIFHSVSIREANKYVLMGGIGLGAIVAGYIPVIFVFLPNLTSIGSRVNLFASIGGAILVTSAIKLISLFAFPSRWRQWFFVASILPFLIVSLITHLVVQRDARVAWEEQRNIWQTLITQVPDLRDQTTVLIVLPDYQDRVGYRNWKRVPISAYWDASSAIRLLYNNRTLNADVLYLDIETATEPTLTAEGLLSKNAKQPTPYKKTVIAVYKPQRRQFTILQELPKTMLANPDILAPNMRLTLCTQCIIHTHSSRERPFKKLIK